MAAIDDLKAAVARLNQSVSTEIQAISDKLTQLGLDNTDITTATTALNNLSDTLDSESNILVGPPPPPTPTPTTTLRSKS